jgi:hypothetical protein
MQDIKTTAPQPGSKQRIDRAQWLTELNGRPQIAKYLPLEEITRPNLSTNEAAYYLNRRPQTLRGWACHSGTGPMVPTRIGGLLAWSTSTVKKLAGVPA